MLNAPFRFGFLPASLALAVLFLAPIVSRADTPPTTAIAGLATPGVCCCDAIKTAYSQMTDAFAENQLDRSLVYLAPDYRQVDPKGHMLNRDGTIKKFRWERAQVRTIQSQCSILAMTVESDGVHVEMATHSSGTGAKRVLFVTVSGTFTNDLHVDDLWVNTPDGWRLKYRQMLQDESHNHAG